MSEVPGFLTVPYGGYYQGPVPPEDAELTHVGPRTPGGEYLRRFWQPVALTDDITDVPLRIKILGEDLVVFRDQSGRLGLLALHCSHRGTSLEFGLISTRGIRCCYHGWLFDVDGRILETPGEPSTSTLKDRLCHGAYPVLEHKGLVFGYFGPPDRRPLLPMYDMFDLPGYRAVMTNKFIWPCNWVQAKDNSMDPVHTAFLHTIVSGAQFTDEFGKVPEMEWQETPAGMVYIATRRIGDHVWVRINDFMPPNVHQFPSVWENGREEKTRRALGTIWQVPIDDTHTMNFVLAYLHSSETMDLATLRRTISVGQTGDRSYDERQRQPGDYDAHVGQGPIAIHAREHLAATDRGVIMLRNIIRRGIHAVQRGEDPRGLVKTPGVIRTYSQDTVIRLPALATPEEDRELLRDVGRKTLAGRFSHAAPTDSAARVSGGA
jgi:phenylpropionate dioxygenase-like ring-hydroxylating dioxygenase large terminal subunit